MTDTQELCPRCHEGVLFTIADREDSYHVKCLFCEYGESRVKDGYEVVKPGDPITKIEKPSGSKGGAS